jgi:uncharacterized membrane protein (UPF0136 family)
MAIFVLPAAVGGSMLSGGKDLMKQDVLVLWIYIVLLMAGGMIGYFKAGSKISLLSAAISAALLSLCAARVVFLPYVADLLLAALLLMFSWRWTKTKKFMPSGFMLALTIAAMALRHIRIWGAVGGG